MHLAGVTGQRLAALFLLGCALFNYPVLSLFDKTGEMFGIPLPYLYIFAAWAGLTGALACVAERTGD